MPERKDQLGEDPNDSLLNTMFNDEERSSLRAALEVNDFARLKAALDGKRITAEADIAEVIEGLSGEEPTPEDLSQFFADQEATGEQASAGGQNPTAQELNEAQEKSADRNALIARVMARVTGQPKAETMRLATALVTSFLKSSNEKIQRAQFEQMVLSMYNELVKLGL